MNGVIVVAPAEAVWASRAAHDLADAHLLVARLYEPAELSSLLARGASTVAIDSRIAVASMRAVRACVTATQTKILLVHDGNGLRPIGSHSWLDARELLGLSV